MVARIVQLALTEAVERWLNGRGPSRAALAAVVDAHLAELTRGLRDLGFGGGRPVGARRPRRIDSKSWADLQAAAEACGLPAHTLLDVCIRRAYAQDHREDREEAAGSE